VEPCTVCDAGSSGKAQVSVGAEAKTRAMIHWLALARRCK